MENAPPCQLFVDPKARPFAIHHTWPVPVHWQQKVKEGLCRDVTMGFLRGPVVDKPVKSCSPITIASKKNGRLRQTLDFQGLNKACMRQAHPSESP